MPHIVGHRGARGEAPENTLASFQVAVDAGVLEIELDVRLSADGHLVVLHDKEVDRTTWGRGPAHRHTLAHMNLMDARRNTPGWHSSTGIPSLIEVLELCPPHMRFQFEVKRTDRRRMHQIAMRLKHLIEERNLFDRVVVTSASATFLRMMRTMNDQIPLGVVCEYRFQSPVRKAGQLRCDWLICHYELVDEDMVRRCKRRRIGISVWTVNDLTEAERLYKLGVDSIISDFPTSFMSHFEHKAKRTQKAS